MEANTFKPAPESVRTADALRDRRVLIVDDDRDFAESLQDLLGTQRYVTRIAHSSEEALRILAHFPAEVALLDIRIGLQSGINLLEVFARRAPDILCVMITAYCSTDTAIEALRRGAYDYLAKPVRAEMMMATLGRCFERIDLRRERDLAQAHLRRSERRYRQLVEDSSAVPWEMDAGTGCLTYVGPQIERLTGIPPARWLTPDFLLNHAHPDDAAALRNLLIQSMAGRHGEVEFRLCVGDAQPLWLRCHVGGAEAADGGIVLGYLFDVSEQVIGRQQQRRLQRQLQQAQRMEAIGYLTGGVAHDFNNILASILGYTGLALERAERDPETMRRYLQEVRNAGEKARSLVQRMLVFSRGGTGQSVPLALGEALKETLRLVRASLPAGIGLGLETPTDEQRVLMDPVQLQQILMNLSLNARDACGDQGLITVQLLEARAYSCECASCHRPFAGEFVGIAVRDTGTGMNAEVIARIFDPFFTTKSLGQGSGLGLSIVHGIVHDHGGHLQVESQPGAGTQFRILLPVLVANDAAADTQPGNFQVVLVEDDRTAARQFQQALEQAGYATTHYADARAALAASQQVQAAQIVVVDQSLPGLTGLDLLHRLHAAGRRQPGLLYTRDTRLLDSMPHTEGVTEVMPRPTQAEELVAAVDRLAHALMQGTGGGEAHN